MGRSDTRVLFGLGAVACITLLPFALTSARASSDQQAARLAVAGALPLIEAYGIQHDGYANMTLAALERDDLGLPRDIRLADVSRLSYCVMAVTGSRSAHIEGPGGKVGNGPCPRGLQTLPR